MRKVLQSMLPALLCVALSLTLEAGDAANQPDEFTGKLVKLQDDYVRGLMGLVNTAKAQALKAEMSGYLKKVLQIRPEHKEAKALDAALPAWTLKPPSGVAAEKARQQARDYLSTQHTKLNNQIADGYLLLASWCAEKNIPDKSELCLRKGLELAPDHDKLNTKLGLARDPQLGWISVEMAEKIKAGLWLSKGEWKKWEDIKAERLATFKAEMEAKLGPGYRYHITRYFNTATNVDASFASASGKDFEKHLQTDLDLLIFVQQRELYGLLPADLAPYNVVVCNTQAEFNKQTGMSVMGVWIPKTRTFWSWRYDKAQPKAMTNGIGTVFHELTHATTGDFMQGKGVPMWLNEGLAGFHEKARAPEGRFVLTLLNIPRMSELIKQRKAGTSINLKGLIGPPGDFEGILGYNRSAIVVHFLFDRGKLRDFLREYKASADAQKALTSTLGAELETIEGWINEYMDQKFAEPFQEPAYH